MRFKLIACEILFREFSALAARSVATIDITFLPKGLHDIGRVRMSERLREALLAVDESAYDAVLFGYALCNGGVTGLAARSIPLVLPRAHDCITLFLGDRRKYLDYFHANPGTYFKTTGWIERGRDLGQTDPDAVVSGSRADNAANPTLGVNGRNMNFARLVAKYGEDNARYLCEELGRMKHYSQLAYIETGVEPDDRFENATRELAAQNGWRFEKLVGNLELMRKLLDGEWDADDFLVVQPGERIQFDFSGGIVRSEPHC